MCGIGGFVGQLSGAQAVGEAMAAALHHRGPDAQAAKLLPRGQGAFAHTRLSVIDLSETANQPWVSDDGQTFLVFNGEIYNFQSLRKKLADEGYKFKTHCDTEVILAQYLNYGIDGLAELDGMFAFAIWDEREQRLLIMRDRMGQKPLYWTKTAQGLLAFASEAKALRPVPGIELELDSSKLPEYLVYGYVSTPNSIFRNIHRLPPAHILTYKPGEEPKLSRYWKLPTPSENYSMELPEMPELVRNKVGRAVEKRLVADVPVGAFLSGGVDSSIVVAEMAARGTKQVRSFAVGFGDDATYDETKYARQVAEQFNTDHTELHLNPRSHEIFETLLHHHDEPYGDSSALAVHAISEATRKHVTVVLTGDGGDEVFAGYTRFRGGLVLSLMPQPAAQILNRVFSRLPEPSGYKNPLSLMRRFVEHAKRAPDEQLLAWNSYFAGPRLQKILRSDIYGAQFDPWAPMDAQAEILAEARKAGGDRLDQILRHNLATYLLDDLLVKTDRMTMAVALEARSPFLDTELIEMAFKLPSSQKMRRGQLKWLLREAYRGILGPDVLDRQKHGFGVPVGKWWSGELMAYVQEHLGSTARVADYLDMDQVKLLLDEHHRGHREHGQRIFALLQLELWLRQQQRESSAQAA